MKMTYKSNQNILKIDVFLARRSCSLQMEFPVPYLTLSMMHFTQKSFLGDMQLVLTELKSYICNVKGDLSYSCNTLRPWLLIYDFCFLRQIDGRITQGENIADNGGLKESFRVRIRLSY
jgi:hypothetical protein